MQTLSIIKPDGVKKRIIGKIITRFEEAGVGGGGIKR
ncbi:nucleoside-diphosphate kinase, partial [Helicobacter ailurogastricus]